MSRVVKRKVNAKGTTNEPPQKALKKAELIEEFQVLQVKFDNIKEENRTLLENLKSVENEKRILIENEKKHIEAIHLLEETVVVLKAKKMINKKNIMRPLRIWRKP